MAEHEATGIVPIEALFNKGLSTREIVDKYYIGVARNEKHPAAEIRSVPSGAIEVADEAGCFYGAHIDAGYIMIGRWYVCSKSGEHGGFIPTHDGIVLEDWEILARPKVA